MITINLQQRALGLCALLGFCLLLTSFYVIGQWRIDWALAQNHLPETSPILRHESAEKIAAIPNQHLFGEAAGDMPISNLQLRVTGIVKVNDSKGTFSKAYISMSGYSSKIYQAGDYLPSGVKINDITSDTVILEHDGRLEKLPLPREKLQFKPQESL